MNIFLFDPLNLESQAQSHPDKLVVKMQLEISQLLANVLHFNYDLSLPKKDGAPYKPTHTKHPCSSWLCFNPINSAYGLKYLDSLIDEYELRYKKHSSFRGVSKYIKSNTNLGEIYELPNSFAIAINAAWLKEFYQDEVISYHEYMCVTSNHRANPTLAKTLYRTYLLRAKTNYAEWRYSTPPDFWTENAQLSDNNGRFCKI